MAKQEGNIWKRKSVKKVTSIGKSHRTNPKNKHKRRNWKAYNGQG